MSFSCIMQDVKENSASYTLLTPYPGRLPQPAPLVGAGCLNVTGLLALVTHALRRTLRRAVAAEMTDLTTWTPQSQQSPSFTISHHTKTHSCSTSDPECSHATCDQSHRTSNKSAHDPHHIRPAHHHTHHRNHQHRHRIHRPAGSCEQCDRPCRTCSTPGHPRRVHRRSRRRRRLDRHPARRPRGTRARCGPSYRTGSMTSPSAGSGTPGSDGLARRSCSRSGCLLSGIRARCGLGHRLGEGGVSAAVVCVCVNVCVCGFRRRK